MQTINSFRITLLVAVMLALAPATMRAGNVFKANNANNLNDPASWVGGATPTAADVAVWDFTVTSANTVLLGANTNWAGIKILDPAGLVTLSAGNTLTNGALGIDMSQAIQNLTFSNLVVLGADQVWNVTNTRTVTVSPAVNPGLLIGTGKLTKEGLGTITLRGTNTYSGGTIVNAGVLQVQNSTSTSAGPTGTGGLTNNDGTTLRFSGGATVPSPFTPVGNVTVDLNNSASASQAMDGAWIGGGSVIVSNAATGSTFTMGGSGIGGGNMNNFTGSVAVASITSLGLNASNTFRFNDGGGNNNLGSANASYDLGNGIITMTTRNRNGSTVALGAFAGGPNTKLSIGSSSTGSTTYSIGGKNTSTTFAGIIAGDSASNPLALTKVGTGTFNLTGNNTYLGATTINGGILKIGDGITSGIGQIGSGAVSDNAVLMYARPDAISIANTITGSGSLVQAGASVLTLTASANAYTGQTIVTNNGTILAGAAGAISPATAVTLGGSGTAGTLDLAGNNVQVSALNTGSGATGSTVGSSGAANPTIFTVNATNGASVFSGSIQDTLPSGGSGVLALVVQNGKLTLSGPNTYSGSTTVSNGTLVVSGSIANSTTFVLASAASVLDVSAGGLSLASGGALSGVGGVAGTVTAANALINPATNGTVGTLSFSNSLALSGGNTVHFDLSVIPASGNDEIVVAGALNLSGLNTIEISPLTSLSAGTYKLFACGSVSGSVANLQLVGAPGSGLTAALSVTGTEVDLVVTAIAAPFIWAGDGTLNQWDYTTANWRSNTVASLFKDGVFAVFDNTGSASPAVDITGPVAPASVTVNATASFTLGSVGGLGKITGVSSLIKTNTGTLTVLTANDYLGGTFINQGTLQVGNGSVAGTTLGNGGVINKGSLVFDQPDNYDFTNVISGTGTLSQSGSGALTLSGNNTFSGATFVSAGTLQVGNGGSSGTLGTNTVFDSAALSFNRADSVVQAGKITGAGTLTVLAGTVAVTASNDLTGLITINSGATLQLGNGGVSGSVVLTNLANNGTLAFNHSANETNSSLLTGAGGVAQVGTNVLTLSGANSYNGNTTVAAGTLKIGAAGTLPFGSGFGDVVLNAGDTAAGTLNLNGFDTVLNGISGSSNSVFGRVVNNSGAATNVLTVGAGDATTTFRGLIQNNSGGGGAIALVKTGVGTFTVGATNSYAGGTVISNGVLALDSNLANNSGGFSGVGPTNSPVVFAGGTLQLFGYNGSTSPNYNSFYNPLVVPAGQTGTLQLFSRGPASGNPGVGCSLSGSGTLNLVVNYVRDSLDGDWSAFTGLINVTPKPAGNDEFRINNKFGYANAAIFLNDGVTMDRASGANPTNNIGELGGTSGAALKAGNSSSGSPTWRVGSKNTTATFAGTILNDGVTSIIKVGTGAWILTGVNTYIGSTTISNGVLALANGAGGDGSIDNSSTINIVSGAALDVSGRSDQTLQLGGSTNQVLAGWGTLRGGLNVGSLGVVAPGGGLGGGTGTLTVTNSVVLNGTAWMKLNRASSPNSDRLASSLSTITYGGALIVTNLGPALQAGDTFTLFSGGSLSAGSFTSVQLPSGYSWNTNQLGVNGSISVSTVYRPAVSSVNFSALGSGTIVLNATNGLPLGPVAILTSTNLALPLSGWTTNASTAFDGSGSLLNYSITVDPTLPHLFILLQAQ